MDMKFQIKSINISMNDQIEQKAIGTIKTISQKNPNMQYRNVNITSFEIVEAIIRKIRRNFND